MPVIEHWTENLDAIAARLKPDLFRTVAELVRIPSENLPPAGNEAACQKHVARRLCELGLRPDVYLVGDAEGLAVHPEYWPGRDYTERPNVNAVLAGSGGGRSLILSGHIDTVPIDTPAPWKHDPLAAACVDGRMYGRGAWDMKAGVAMNLTVLLALHQAGIRLKGDLTFETVVDEEFGGANGTLAARLRGYGADAAVLGEPTSLCICPAQRGGRVAHILLRGSGGMLATDASPARAVDQLGYVLTRLPEFSAHRAGRVPVDPYYATCAEPFAVWVTNLSTGAWGWTQPMTVPEQCRVELYWQTMPEEEGEDVRREFLEWWDAIIGQRAELFPVRPEIVWPMRWLPGSAIPAGSGLVREFREAAASTGVEAEVRGLDAPGDMYIFQKCFGIPALMWGPDGANAHQADEYVDLESLHAATRALLHFVVRWCGVSTGE
jgi:acetylornithine deacetylase